MPYNETPTSDWTIMPNKFSVLTTAMLAPSAKQDPATSDDYANHPAIQAENSRFRKVAAVAAVGCAAFLAVAWKIETLRNGEGDYETEA